MRILELNKPAISNKLSVGELSVRPYVSKVMYMGKSRIIQTASESKPVFRLCKDYEVDGKHFALNLLTDHKDMKKAESFLDKCAKSLKREAVVEALNSQAPFTYLDKEYGAK